MRQLDDEINAVSDLARQAAVDIATVEEIADRWRKVDGVGLRLEAVRLGVMPDEARRYTGRIGDNAQVLRLVGGGLDKNLASTRANLLALVNALEEVRTLRASLRH